MLLIRAKMTVKSYSTLDRIYQFGVHARYRRLTQEWGFKFFAYKEQRDENYDLHLMLYDKGIGPEVKDKFSAVSQNGIKVYGYLIQHASKSNVKAQDKLVKLLSKYKLKIFDLHPANVGVIGNKPVIIDCSMNTAYYTKYGLEPQKQYTIIYIGKDKTIKKLNVYSINYRMAMLENPMPSILEIVNTGNNKRVWKQPILTNGVFHAIMQ